MAGDEVQEDEQERAMRSLINVEARLRSMTYALQEIACLSNDRLGDAPGIALRALKGE